MSEIMDPIKRSVHEYYWEADINCARTTLLTLAKLFGLEVREQTVTAAIGLHGAGGYRAQCGIVEGSLMFLAIIAREWQGKSDSEIAALCRAFAEAFEARFGSLSCAALRPGGFREDDPPHLCESLTAAGIAFTAEFLRKETGAQ